MATGAPGTNGVWQYGEDDSETTFSALLNKVASTTNTQFGLDRARLTTLELSGRVIQAAYNIQDTLVTTTAAYPGVNTNLSTTITPRYNNSRMFVIVSHFVQPVALANSFDGGVGIWRNGSVDLGGNSLTANAGTGAGGALAIRQLASIVREDYPNTTSAVTYSTKIWLTSGLRMEAQPGGQRSTISVFEVKV